ncbi:glycosyltransferase [Candidatus Sumerlaeota bacterium]|nr:glycosyltransferase [Candidatus Sumerlaeota bacterium]
MKVALVHDWLNGMRGGEKVLEVVCDIFPNADLYTLFYEPDFVSDKIRRMEPRPSVLQRFPFARRCYRHLLPLYPWAVERFDMSSYDAVISLSHCAAKGVRVAERQIHVCYCFTPMRYIWDQYGLYFEGPNRRRLQSLVMRLCRERLRSWDVSTAQRVSRFIAASMAVTHRIARYYNREAAVVHPPVDTDRFRPLDVKQNDYFLIVAAIVPYKRIDLAVETFSRMGRRLLVAGDGPERSRLERRAGRSVRFLGWVSDEQLVELYNGCRALIFPGEEDFGITALEAQACGRPVIALRRGGALETVVEGRTGLFFSEQTSEALSQAVESFDSLSFDRTVIRAHAEKFGRDRFRRELEKTILGILSEHGLEATSPTAL